MRSYGTTMEAPGRSLRVGWTFPTEAQFKSKPQYYIDRFAYDSTAIPATLDIETALVAIPNSDTKALRLQRGRLGVEQRRQEKVLSTLKDALDRTEGVGLDKDSAAREARIMVSNAKKSVEFILSRTTALLVAVDNELAKRNRNKKLFIVLPVVALVIVGIIQRRK